MPALRRLLDLVRRRPCAALALAYLGLRLWSEVSTIGHARSFPDTLDYEASARLPLTGSAFWQGARPWGLPLLYRLLPGPRGTVVPVLQIAVSIAAWLFLAWTVARVLRRPGVGVAAFALVLVFSLAHQLAEWDGVLLTESLTVSLTAVLVALVLRLVRVPGRRTVALALLVSLALSSLRDTSSSLAVALLVPVAGLLWLRGSRRTGLVLAGGVLAVALGMYASSTSRWQFARAPRDASGHRVQADPAAHRRGSYLWYLVTHPGVSVGDPLRGLRTMITPNETVYFDTTPGGLDYYAPTAYRRAIPRSLEWLVYVRTATLVLVWTAVGVAILALLALGGVVRRWWLVPALLSAGAVVHGIVVWDGSTVELGRHALLVGELMRLAVWLVALAALDAWLAPRAPVRPAAAAAA